MEWATKSKHKQFFLYKKWFDYHNLAIKRQTSWGPDIKKLFDAVKFLNKIFLFSSFRSYVK